MIRLQDIAEMAGVSRTTVSNVINGNTKRVSQKTIDKITTILKEQNYVPHMGSVMLSGHGSRIIGVVLGFSYAHGMQSLQDPFVGELIGTIQMETEENGYYVMLIGGESIQNVVDIASKWNVEGLLILGYNEEQYRSLSRRLNKKMILIDAYPEGAYTFQNVGIDDYSGGYQIGEYLRDKKIDEVVVVGKEALEIKKALDVCDTKYAKTFSFMDNEEVALYLMAIMRPEDVVLIKGSHGMKMDEIVKILTN